MRPTTEPTCGLLVCLLLVSMIIALIVVGLIVHANWPEETLEFEINSLSVSPFLVLPSSITASWNITLLARNPFDNKIVYYDGVDVSVYYHNLFLTSSRIPMNGSLYQSPRDATSLQAELAISSVKIADLMESPAIFEEWRNRVVGFGVRAEATVRIGTSEKRLEMKLVIVNCDYLKVGISLNQTAGVLLGGSRCCDVKYKS